MNALPTADVITCDHLSQVFLTEYAGPLLIYLMFYFRVPFIYAPKYDFTTSKHWVVQ